VIFTPGRASFTLPVPPAGAAHATIEVPGEQADVHLSAGSITRRTTRDGRTIVDAALDPASATEVWWSMRDSAPLAAARETRTVADVMSLITLTDSEVRMVALVDLAIVQGEPRTVELRLPDGYQLMGITGSTLETSEPVDGKVVLTLADPTARRHQLLVSLERPHVDGSFSVDTGLVQVSDAQRESGEIGVEGIGPLDLAATERPGMHRIDIRELNPALQSLARTPVLAAFRYQRTPSSVPGLALAVTRFRDSGVLAAMVDRLTASPLKWRLWGVRRSKSSLAVMARSGFRESHKASRPSWRRSLDSTRLPRTSWSALSEPGWIFKCRSGQWRRRSR
jgi:hypothetical protein